MGRLVFRSSTSVAKGCWPGRVRPLVDRFWEKVDVRGDDECWLWLSGTDGNGYGRIRVNGSRAFRLHAHRVAYELLVGPIQDGFVIDHFRMNPGPRHAPCSTLCVNPGHLEVVPVRVNNLRGISPWATNARKSTCPRGHTYDVTFTPKADGSEWRGCRRCRKAARQRFNARKKGGVS